MRPVPRAEWRALLPPKMVIPLVAPLAARSGIQMCLLTFVGKGGTLLLLFPSLSLDMRVFCSGYAKHATLQQRRYVLTTVDVSLFVEICHCSIRAVVKNVRR